MGEKIYRIKPPACIVTKNFNHPTPYEVVVVKDGVGTCKMQHTRDQLMRWGWTDVTGGVMEKVKKAISKKPSGKKKGGLLSRLTGKGKK